MLALVLFILTLALVGLGLWCGHRTAVADRADPRGDAGVGWAFAALFSFVGALVVFLFVLIPTGSSLAAQIGTNRDIDATHSIEKINTRKANQLIPQFKSFLAEQYPQYEQQVFHDISHPGDVSLFFARYPELHASQSLADLVGRIDKLNSDIYNQQIKRTNLIAQARTRKANPWLIGALLEEPRTDKEAG